MKLPVTLFDYGVGNLHSITKALERSGADVRITREADDLLEASTIVLPGVGAFGACMEPLTARRDEIRAKLLEGTPCLAVCIGMQLLFDRSEESPGVEGLAFLSGDVKRFPSNVGKVPHMGWNALQRPIELPPWDSRSGVGLGWFDMLPGSGAHVYYVHSYHGVPTDPVTLLSTTYGDRPVEFAAACARGNTLATQFHPEKSSQLGLAIVDHWVQAVRTRLAAEAKP